MTIDELREAYSAAYQTKLNSYDYDETLVNCIAEAERAGIRAVVTALRHEIYLEFDDDEPAKEVVEYIDNQILGSDAGEKVAGGPSGLEREAKAGSASSPAPATTPALDVCVACNGSGVIYVRTMHDPDGPRECETCDECGGVE